MENWHRLPTRPEGAILLLALLGCSAPLPESFTEADARAVRDTVIGLENALNLAVDGLDCNEGFTSIEGQEPVFVSNGHVVRTDGALREQCERMVAERTGATFMVDTLSAHVLSPDAAYVVREGGYTIDYRDGHSDTLRLIMTTVWARRAGGWKMVHLHESVPASE